MRKLLDLSATLRAFAWVIRYDRRKRPWQWAVANRERFEQSNPLGLGWWASWDGDYYEIGPCATREEAIWRAKRDCIGEDFNGVEGCNRIWLVEASQRPVQLAQWVDGDQLLEAVSEAVEDDLGGEDGVDFDFGSAAQVAHLTRMVRLVLVYWQWRHGFVVRPWQFTHVRSTERYTWFSGSEAVPGVR